jgi:hypothetical protein
MQKIRIDAPRTHRGVSDASGAVSLEPGGTRFLMASDEDQEVTCIRLYDAVVDGDAIEAFSLDHEKLNPDPEEPELDLEAAAWLGERIVWIGSHSRSKKANIRPSRHRLFATQLSWKNGKPALTVIGVPYCSLVADLGKRWPSLELDPKLPPKEGGLSIEGLSNTSNADELLIGVRSPLIDEKALIVRLSNAEEVLDCGATPRFDEPLLLDFAGRGIRSIEFWPERQRFVILAGPAGDKGDFSLYWWVGTAAAQPEEIEAVRFSQMKLGECVAPEAVFIEARSGTLYVLFDEGRRPGSPSFRSIAIHGL